MTDSLLNIGSLPARHALYRPNHTAVVFESTRLTYQEFNERVNRSANALLGFGLGLGSKIATILPNCVELLEVYWAAAKIGAVVVPLSTLLRGPGLLNLLRDSDCQTIVTCSSFAPTVDEIRGELDIGHSRYVLTNEPSRAGYISYSDLTALASNCEPPPARITRDTPYNIIYSSGTTGSPKGIVHTHYIRSMYCTLFSCAFRMHPESVMLHAGSIVFNGAFITLMPSMYLGATYILQPRFDPLTFIRTVHRERVTHVMMVPSQIVALLSSPHFSPEALSSLEMLGTVGAPLHLEHKQQLISALPGRFYELYGLTEGFVTILDKEDSPRKLGSVGTPPPFFEMRIFDTNDVPLPPGQTGEIVGRGPILMPGYYNQPALTREAIQDGWLHTGDLGYVDDDGFLYLVDRKKDLIVSGGINVYPRDIEEIAVQHPAVSEVAVFGITDPKWGETPAAAVILREKSAVSAEELCAWINERVTAKFQRVSKVVTVEEFPRSSSGKTLKRVLREQVSPPRPQQCHCAILIAPMKVIVIIPAAGLGTRMSSAPSARGKKAYPSKQFTEIGGTPILLRTLRLFANLPAVSEIVVALRQNEVEGFRTRLAKEAPDLKGKSVRFVEGGEHRQHSVANALNSLSAAPDDIVLVHDAVRPFVSPEIIQEVIDCARKHGAAVAAMPAVDTVKQVERTAEGAVVTATLIRERIVMTQTPQGFRYDVLKKAFEEAAGDGFLGTDESSLVERSGHEVAVVMGSPRNIKITTPDDLELAEFFLSRSA